MADDLTKLSGPELAKQVIAVYYCPELVEAARRLREDTREWQRSLERERDGLRERLEAEMRKPIPVVRLEAGDAYVAEMLHERDGLRERVTGLEFARDQLRASCTNQRKELHSLNVERKATLTKLEETQEDNRRICARMDEALKERDSLRESAGKAFNDRARWRDWSDGFDCVPVGAGDDDAMAAIGAAFVSLKKRIAELEEQRELDAGSLRSAINNAQSRLAQVKRLEAQLRDAQNSGADEWTADGEAVPPSAVVRYEDANPNWPLGKPEPAERKAKAALPRKSYPVMPDPAFDCDPIADSPYVAAVAVAHGKAVATSKADAHVVSTAELSAFEVAAASAADALHVDADGLGFVKREWLYRHRASVAQQRKLLSEPAERKAQEERRYGPQQLTLSEAIAAHGNSRTMEDVAGHIRETIATIDAVRAWCDKIRAMRELYRGDEFVADLLEVLNGKR